MGILRDLKQFNESATTDVEELVLLSAQAKSLRAELEARNLPVDEWLDDMIRRVGRAIDEQSRDRRELRLKQIRAERSQLLTAGERRAKLEAEEAALVAEMSK